MKKIIKILSISVAALLVLLLVAELALPSLVDTDVFRQELSRQVKQRTGLTLTIDGELSFSVFPWLGIRTERVRLSQPTGFGDDDFLSVDGADLKVRLLPLFRRDIEVSTIVLRQPTIHYRVDALGRSSLDGFLAEQGSVTTIPPADNSAPTLATTPTATSTTAAVKTDTAVASIVIAGVSISDGELLYDDRRSGNSYQLKHLNVQTEDLLSGKSVAVSLSGTLSAADKTFEPIEASLSSRVTLNLSTKSVAFNQLVIDIKQASQQLVAAVDQLSLNQLQQSLDVNQLQLDINAQNLLPFPLSPRLTIAKAHIDLAQQQTSTIPFTLLETGLGISTTGHVTLKDWNGQLMYKGALNNKAVNLQTLLKKMQIAYTPSDSQVLQSLNADTQFSGSLNGIALQSMKVMLDESSITGDVSIIDFSAPHYRFDLSLDKINLDRYVPLSTETNSASAEKTQGANTGLAMAIPVGLFRNLPANGVFRIANLQANGAKLSDITVGLVSKDKRVVITPSAKLYQGTLNGSITFLDEAKQASLQIDTVLAGVNFEPLFSDTKITEQISGVGTINTNVTVVDVNGKQSNQGVVAIVIKDGAVKGIDIKKILDDTQAKFDELRGKGTKVNDATNNDTHFAEMTATLHVNNYIITNDDLTIKAPAFRIGGKGDINLNDESLDYTTLVTVVNTNEGQGGKEREDLKGLAIPVSFTGKLVAPEYKIDFKALLKANAQKDIDKKESELKIKAAEKLGITTTNKDGEKTTPTKAELREEAKKKLLDKLFK